MQVNDQSNIDNHCPRCEYYSTTAFPSGGLDGNLPSMDKIMAYDTAAPKAHQNCKSCLHQRIIAAWPKTIEALQETEWLLARYPIQGADGARIRTLQLIRDLIAKIETP
jgi:hypothetical protein